MKSEPNTPKDNGMQRKCIGAPVWWRAQSMFFVGHWRIEYLDIGRTLSSSQIFWCGLRFKFARREECGIIAADETNGFSNLHGIFTFLCIDKQYD